ncbi:MAG: PDZ domain-containing protein, partial [Caldisericia bacterium]|nr:PDZ domain-containing protein [Caldisericia bacterium]
MNNKNLWTVLIVSLVIVAFGAGMFTGILINSGPSANSNIESYEFLNRAVKSALGSYFTELNDEMLAKALLHGLDPWSTYFTKEEFSNFTEATTGVYFGIGVMISLDDTRQYARCTRIFKSSPAEDAGLSEGWLIKAVNGEEVVGVSLDLVVSKIKGPEGTTVDITFLDDGVEITKTITRAKIIADSVFTRQLEHNIAYIELMSFMPESPKEMRVALDIAMQKGSKKFILDLRNNTGGLLSSCQLIANQFLEEGPLVHVVDKSGKKQTMRTTGTRFPYDLV